MKRKKAAPVTLHFPNADIARAFSYQFKDYELESNDCSQTVIIELQNVTFDHEIRDPRIRLAVGAANTTTPEFVRSIVGGISI